MNTLTRLVMTAAMVNVVGGALPGPLSAATEATRRPAPGGTILTEVRDEDGRPVDGAVVSAVGRRIVTGVTDADGRCALAALPAGDYLVRVFRDGYVSTSDMLVIGAPGLSTTWTFVLTPQTDRVDAEAPEVMAAGFVGGDASLGPAVAPARDEEHDHGEVAWRLRHLKRSVLKDTAGRVRLEDYDSTDEFDDAVAALFERSNGPARVSASLLADQPLAGQFNLLTTGAFDSPEQLMSAGTLARGVALVSLGSSAGRYGDWAVQGAMTQGDVASWMVSGSYVTRAPADHRLETGITYALQRYDGANPAALAAVADGDRDASVVYAFDSWSLSRGVSLVYGARLAKYGYIEKSLLSPRARLTVSPTERLRVSAEASRRAVAPGAEEFVPSMMTGTWLPPERTFSPITGSQFVPGRTTHFEVAAEHDLSDTTIVGLRSFHQRTKDQLVTMFGMGTVAREASDLGHYYVGNAGNVDAYGWTVSVRQVFARRVRGAVDYTVTTAEWEQTPASMALAELVPGLGRSGTERVHNVTTSMETDIPLTATRVFALYRINTAYVGSDLETVSPALAARFDVQVTQSLPFMDFSTARWEMLFGVRNLFRDVVDDASVYDELLTVRPPKRIVGGLTVRF